MLRTWSVTSSLRDAATVILIRPARRQSGPKLAPEPGTIAVRTHVHLRAGIELVISPDEIELDQAELRQLIRSILDATDQAVGPSPKRKE